MTHKIRQCDIKWKNTTQWWCYNNILQQDQLETGSVELYKRHVASMCHKHLLLEGEGIIRLNEKITREDPRAYRKPQNCKEQWIYSTSKRHKPFAEDKNTTYT